MEKVCYSPGGLDGRTQVTQWRNESYIVTSLVFQCASIQLLMNICPYLPKGYLLSTTYSHSS